MLHLLLIDNNLDDRLLIINQLQQELAEVQVEQVSTAEGFQQALVSGQFELVITEYHLGWDNGLNVLKQIKSRYPHCPVIMFTGSGTQEIAVEAMKAGLDDYIVKSAKHDIRLPIAVRTALEQAESKRPNQQLLQQIQHLNADLASQLQDSKGQLQQAFEFEATLKRITDQVRDSLDENRILQTAVEELTLAIGANACNAALYNLQQRTSTICYEYTNELLQLQGRVIQMANFPEGYQQLLRGQFFQHCSLIPHPIRGHVAMLSCPIYDVQGVIGDLWLIHSKDYAYSEQDIRLVQQVTNQCAIAIRQSRLYKAAQAQVKELQRLDQLKNDFLSTISHELRTPIANMKMAIQMLKFAPRSEREQRYLNILQTECAREAALIDDLLDLQKLEAATSFKNIGVALDLQDWLPTLVEPFRISTQERQQTLELNFSSDLPPLVVDHNKLKRCMAELLNNACKYTPKGGKIVFSVHHKSDRLDSTSNAITIFTISNQAEIPAAELPYIFEKFYRVPNTDPWGQGGTGLGLALVQKLVEQLGGTIQVDSSNGWTTFTVTSH